MKKQYLPWEALLNIAVDLNQDLKTKKILEKSVYHLAQILEVDDSSILLWDEKSKTFSNGHSTNMGAQVAKRVRHKEGATRWIVQNQAPLTIGNTASDPFSANIMIRERGIRSYLGMPIQHKGHTVGVLYGLSKTERRFTESELAKAQKFSEIIAAPLHQAAQLEAAMSTVEIQRIKTQLVLHDLNGPLSLLKGYCDLLSPRLEALLEIEQLEWVNAMRSSMQTMDNLLMLLLRKEEMDGAPSRFLLGALLPDIVPTILSAARLKKLHVDFEFWDEPICLVGDQILIKEAFSNVISNALKYTGEGGSIFLRTWRDAVWGYFSVQDTGIGMDSLVIASIFEPYSRLEPLGQAKGFGLGLSLVKSIVDQHNGRIVVDSEPNEGTTFTIMLPLCQSP